ncbi:hypothetical protein PT974_03251 [Cladobotryum mycophilum]|uniref:TLDc domain-containing protein n=1 Tax=Cladobotryum mycophilum TaxID=491253 RepID=A0ABR0SSY0_9HYPO
MFAVFVDILNNIALGPQNRKVKRYLDEAMYESVSDDPGKVLLSQLRGFKERELLRTTFDKYCIEDASQHIYWNEGSFGKHVRSTFSESAISDPAIRLLWRSFHFYAYHPFPHQLQDAKINYDAFQRAALLTIFQCDDLLGTREFEWYWRKDEAFFRRASCERIFRSIGVPETATQLSSRQSDMTSIVSDAMDVLVMTAPQFMHVAQREVKREHVSTLIGLLLRMRLKKDKWAWLYHHGDFAEANPAAEELAEALTGSLFGNESDQTMAPKQLSEAISLIPNLQLRFYQLWAVLFQPSAATGDISQAPEAAPTHVNGAISLFAPQIKTENRYDKRSIQRDARIVLEKKQVLPDSSNIAMVGLVQSLSHHSSAYIVLLTGVAAATAQKAVVGAYFPGLCTDEDNEKYKTGANNRHMLFQLHPRFRFLPCAGSNVPVSDLVKTEGIQVFLNKIAIDEGSAPCNKPYWIRHSNGQGAGLRIDPETKTATLVSGDQRWYGELNLDGNNVFAKNYWKVVVQNAQMDIFTVT